MHKQINKKCHDFFFPIRDEVLASDILLFILVLYSLKLCCFQQDNKYLLSNYLKYNQIFLFSNEGYFASFFKKEAFLLRLQTQAQ